MTIKNQNSSKKQSFLNQWRVPIALWLALFVVSFNVYVMTVTIVPITRDLNAIGGSIQNVLVLISLVMASFVPTSQNLGDIYGHKKLFILGLLTFGVGLVVTALSPNVVTLTIGYGIITGLGATPLVTLPWTLMNLSYQGRQREFALLALSLALVTGSLVGPFLGGYLTTASDWRWAFGPQVVMVIIIWLLARPVPEIIKVPDKSVDLSGGILSFLGLATILLGLNLTNEYGWWTPRKLFQIGNWTIPPFSLSIVPVLVVAGVILLTVFAFYWRRREAMQEKTQIWRFGLFRQRQFTVGLATSTLYTIGTAGLTYTLYLFLQTALGLTSFDTAFAVSPYYATMLLVMLATFQLGRRLAPKYIIQIGLVVLMLGLWLLANALTPKAGIWQLIPGLVVMGVGAGLVIGQMAGLTLSVADPEAQGESSGIYNALQDLGYSLGVSIFGVGLIYLTSVAAVDGILQSLDITVTDTQRQTIIADLEESLQIFSEEELAETLKQLPVEVQQAVTEVAQGAEFKAMQSTLRGVAIALLLALIASLFLPHNKMESF